MTTATTRTATTVTTTGGCLTATTRPLTPTTVTVTASTFLTTTTTRAGTKTSVTTTTMTATSTTPTTMTTTSASATTTTLLPLLWLLCCFFVACFLNFLSYFLAYILFSYLEMSYIETDCARGEIHNFIMTVKNLERNAIIVSSFRMWWDNKLNFKSVIK